MLYNLTTHAEFKNRLIEGGVTATEFQLAWEAFNQARDRITTELMSKSKSELRISSGLTKDRGVRRILHYMEKVFTLGDSVILEPLGSVDGAPTSQTEAISRMVAKTDQARLDKYAANNKKIREDMERAINNPQTLDDFRRLLRLKGVNALSDEQLARYDELSGEEEENRINRANGAAVVNSIDMPEGVKLNLIEGRHEKRKCAVWVVQISQRVDRAVYDELNARAKMLGGYYSNYIRSQAGFQFLDKEMAERFMVLATGENHDRSDILQEMEERRVERRADRLKDGSERIMARAEEAMSRDRLDNTRRRAAMAAAAEQSAREEAYLADVMDAIADRMRACAARWLSKVKAATETMALLTLLHNSRYEAEKIKDRNGAYERSFRQTNSADIRHAPYPWPSLHVSPLEELATALADRKGHKASATKVMKMVKAARAKGQVIIRPTSHEEADFFADFAKAGIESQNGRHPAEMIERSMETYKRITRIGLTSPEMMRCALRELTDMLPALQSPDPIKEAERALVGVPIPGFFPTTPELGGEVVEYLGVEGDGEGVTFLEPEAGKCDLAVCVRGAFPKAKITCVEIVPMLVKIGRMKGFDVREADFLQWEPEDKFDRVVMNPPFENGADMIHIRRAYEMLKPRGRLVAIMANRETEDFRSWRERIGGMLINVVEGAFQRAERSTGVTVRMILLEKADAAPAGVTFEKRVLKAAA